MDYHEREWLTPPEEDGDAFCEDCMTDRPCSCDRELDDFLFGLVVFWEKSKHSEMNKMRKIYDRIIERHT